MATATDKFSHVSEGQVEEHEEDQTFDDPGLDPCLNIHALTKKGPLILEGKDVVAWTKTGSEKTFAYVLPLLQKVFSDSASKKKLAPTAFVLVPTRELSQQDL